MNEIGGTTIVVYGEGEAEVFEKLKGQILTGIKLGLWPDSSAVIINGDNLNSSVVEKTAKLFSVKLDDLGEKVDFEQVEKGTSFHVETAAKFHKAPEPGQLLGTLHMHT